MATISWQLRAAYVGSTQGTITVDDARDYNVGTHLTAGGGTITEDAGDSALIHALDAFPALMRSGTTEVPPAVAKSTRGVRALMTDGVPTVEQIVVRRTDGSFEERPISSVGGSPLPPISSSRASMVAAAAMATPPTVTPAAAQMSSSTRWDCSTNRYRFNEPSVAYGGTQARMARLPRTPAFPDDSAGDGPLLIESQHDGQVLQSLIQAPVGSYFQMWVNNQPIAVDPQAYPGADNVLRIIQFDFGSFALRQIQLELFKAVFYGHIVKNTDSLAPPESKKLPMVLGVGDSYLRGTGPTSPLSAYANHLGRLLGWNIAFAQGGVGSTGIIANNSGGGYKYIDRVAKDVYPFKGTAAGLIIQGSINDQPFTAANALYLATVALIADVRANMGPTFPIILTSHMYSAADSFYDAVYAQLKQAAIDTGVVFVDTRAPIAWNSGTGKVGAPDNTGTADRNRAADGIHDSNNGTLYHAFRAAGALKALA